MSLKILIIISSIVISGSLGQKSENSTSNFEKNYRRGDLKSFVEHASNHTNDITHRIIGGKETNIEKWPWMAGVYFVLKNSELDFIGGASIITNRHLLTVAHVLSADYPGAKEAYKVVLLGSKFMGEGDLFEIQEYYVHPGYKKGSKFNNDFGIIQLVNTIPFTDVMRPIHLPDMGDEHRNYEGQLLTTIGWGVTSSKYVLSFVLKEVNITIMSEDVCQQAVDVPTKQFMCGGDVGRNSACVGDSGGPIMVANGEKFKIVGMTSFGMSCGTPRSPAYYIKVAPFLKWINQILSNIDN